MAIDDSRARYCFAACLIFARVCSADIHTESMAQSLTLFKNQVRPLFVANCVKCHSGEQARSNFNLTTREGLLAGGNIGISVVPGHPKESRLLNYLGHREGPFMPPGQPPLSSEAVAQITKWIEFGAAYDQPLTDQTRKRATALQVTASDREYWAYKPLQRTFESSSIDGFVKARQNDKHLTPAPQASLLSLIRRLYFDVTGLPPGPQEIRAFLADDSQAAYGKLVDQLLARPQFGERWARHWLDVARFAESHGFEHDSDRKTAFHYRDFVIRAFNQDMPYDQFVRWQLAGDELAPGDPLALAATGFLAAGVHATQITINEAERVRYDEMDDMLATTGSAMLATTVACARCHDHKYDPIPTRDYYRMLSAFTATVRSEVTLPSGSMMIASEGEHIKPIRLFISSETIPDLYKDTYFLNRGDTEQKAGVASLGFLQVLTRSSEQDRWHNASKDPRTSGRRAALSQWMTDTEAGAGQLLARVIVNRVWQHYFGRGIVSTTNDFGTQGDRPTHPELLDWLANELIRNGWHLKPIHKLILVSEAYKMGDSPSAENENCDPDNQFLWRRLPRRLEAEAIRDNALAVSGMLDTTMFGPGTLDEKMRRRSIYFTVKRSQLVPTMQMFDWPDTLTSQGERAVTTSPSQALVFMNDPQFRRMAEAFARRIENNEDRIGSAYWIAYGRPPSERERTLAQAFVKQQTVTDFCAALMSGNEFIYIE